jgi:hypothetical protein
MENTEALIAKFMGGYVTHTEKYTMPHGSQSEGEITHWSVPNKLPSSVDHQMASVGVFNYIGSWDWLMPVIRKINGMGKEYQFTIFKTYVSCTVERSGKFYKDFSFSHAEYITEEQSDIKAAFNLVIKFIEWYNQINNEINNETNNKT